MTTYGQYLRTSTELVINMKLVLLWFVICIAANNEIGAEEFYPDVARDEYVLEELARYLHGGEQREPRPDSPDSLDSGFSFRFPERGAALEEPAPFAVSPSDPRYYQDSRFRPDPSLFPQDSTSSNVEDEEEEEVKASSPPPEAEDPQKLQQAASQSQRPVPSQDDTNDLYFIAIVAGCSAAAVVGIIAVGISWYRLQKHAKAAADVEYPAYGVTGPNKEVSPTGDRRLAQSAQMYHYQHQKQQIIAMESRLPAERNGSVSEAESEEENEEGDYTVYECPGLAPTGEMEVKNPLFHDDPTPATPAPTAPTPSKEQANGGGEPNKKQQP